jgi:hypothetical protein
MLIADGNCYNGTVEFVVTNTGGDMVDSTYFYTTDDWGNMLTDGWLWLLAGESQTITVPDVYTSVTLHIDEYGLLVTTICAQATEEGSANGLDVISWCDNDNSGDLVFMVTNNGEDMPDYIWYSITYSGGETIDDGWLYLHAGETMEFRYPRWYEILILNLGDGSFYLNCQPIIPTEVPTEVVITEEPTEVPTEVVVTEEPTVAPTEVVITEEPTAAPTEVVVVTEEPTEVPTEVVVTEEPTAVPTEVVVVTEEPTTVPTAMPTAAPTSTPSDGPLGCQQNNPGRLDCSSLRVTVVCEGNTAVFTITNMGKPGEGDMRAPTAYRVSVNNTVIDTGDVLLTGGTSMQVSYSAGGQVTLEANQQVGHPGKSKPQATINCGS